MKPKRPRDTNQLAKFIVDLSVGETKEPDPLKGKNRSAVERGRRGGIKDGAASVQKSPKLRAVTKKG
jgi:hypothetical protein